MGASTWAHSQELVNTLGHSAGVLVFGIFIALLLRQRTAESLRRNRLPLLSAALALGWNFASIVVLGMGSSDSFPRHLFAALGFCALSFLPAVLLDLCFGSRMRGFIAVGYLLGAAATAFHLAELVRPATSLHRIGLGLITIGFSSLTLLTAAAALRGAWDGRRSLLSRALAAMGLILLSASFAHFAEGHADEAWSAELAFHHAGIPLAMFIILQNQRFVLLDALIRFLASILLAGAFTFGFAQGVAWLSARQGPNSPFLWALGLVAGCLFLVLYAFLRGAFERWLSHWWFGVPDLKTATAAIRDIAGASPDEDDFLDRAKHILAGLTGSELIGIADPDSPIDSEKADVEATVPLRLGPGDVRHVLLGPRRGGRPYLSDDLAALRNLAAQISGQVEQLRQSELRRLVTQAELRALQAQIHPHFLFNAFNTLYGVIPREAASARRLVLNLADVLRYFFRSENSFIALREEMRVVEAYLEIEKLRLGSKLVTEIDIDPAALSHTIPILSIEPLVENAVKHGVSTKPEGGRVRVSVRVAGAGLDIAVEDTGGGFRRAGKTDHPKGHGVGLKNVARRLAICYGAESELLVESKDGVTRVGFRVPVIQLAGALH